MAQAKQDLQAIINAAAEKEGLDPELLQKIGGLESSLRPGAKNPKSTAKGLFQFVDATWKEMGGKPGEQYNPQKNAELGARYVKKNFQTLSETLGREPSYGEVYAAHFFGPTGAKALLTKADPSAPIEQSLAMFESPKRVAKVLKQNPNLKGKTTGQVLQELDTKMGSKKPTEAPATVVAPTAPVKPKMEMFRRPVPRFIRSEAPNLGTGYNAALALMGMTDTEEDALTAAQETIAQNEEDDSVADFGQAKQMLAQVQAPNAFAKQQPRMLAEGGEVAPEKSSAKSMLKEIGRSTQYLPADIVGSPVDLINLGLKGVDAMTGSKLAQEMPVGGAEWIIDKANKYGLMDKPTGSMTETLTRLGTSVLSPAAGPRAAVAAGKAVKGTAKAALEDISMAATGQGGSKIAQQIMAPGTTFATEPAAGRAARSMLDEIDPEVRKLVEEPKAQARFQGPELPKRTLTTPSKDRPFVSPLDKFFEKGDKPVTVEQLTNQLAKSSRDYEMSRVNQLLEGKSPKDKVRPSDLLKQLEETSPSRFRVEIKEPDPKRMEQFHAGMENPFPSKPMGTVNLLEDITSQEKLATTYMRNLSDKEGLYRNIYVPENEATKAAQELETFFATPMAKNSVVYGEDLASQFKVDAPKIRDLSKKVDGIYHEMNVLNSPLSNSAKFGFDFFGEQKKLIDAAYEKYPDLANIGLAERLKKLDALVNPALTDKFENAAFLGLDKKYGTNILSHKQALGENWSKLDPSEKNKVVQRMLGDVIGGDYTKAQVQLKELKGPYSDVVANVQREQRPYSGQHTSITQGPEGYSDTFNKPISFSRFQDVTLPTKENVMVIPELQSDRFQDVLQKGTKSGSQYKDIDELAQLDQDLDSVTRKLYKTTDAPVRDQLTLESKKIEQRMANLRERIDEGTYNTPEFIPGVERMPQVMQQIMIKNAVYAGIQRGKNGVLFPGSDSAQAQLYEKLPNNLRTVIKDLGAGFEIRKVPLTYEGGYPQGKTVDRYGIFWKDDAAKRISKEGVRFKKGGMVDKNDADNQKYI
jgi:hypothetical protein